MLVPIVTDAKSDDFILDLTEFKPNSNAATAAALTVPLTRHQITVELSGDAADVTVTLTAKPTGAAGFEEVEDGTGAVTGDGGQITFIIRDCSLDAIKIGTGVLASNTYTVRYVGTGDYNEDT